MNKKQQQNKPKLNSLLDVQKMFPDEKTCRDFLIQQRWNGKLACIKCGSDKKIYLINDGQLLKCADCRKQFSPRVGTFFEDSPISLQKWFFAIYLIGAHKKGISSCQLARDIQVSQKTAWFMLHRIRFGIKTKAYKNPLSGTIEADETYIGGKHKGKRGRGSENKKPVFGMVARNGDVRAIPVENVKMATLQPIIEANVAKGSNVMTDELHSYNKLSENYEHETVSHAQKEYVRGNVHTQNIENFWSLLKRGILGIYHHVSPEHLHRYVDEFEYRYNSRKSEDTQRFVTMLSNCEGRLTFAELTGGQV